MDSEIIHTALENLTRLVPVTVDWIVGEDDAEGQVRLKLSDQELCLNVEVKAEVKTSMLPRLLIRDTQVNHFMVIAGSIQPKAKEVLRMKNIAYLEANGNIYLHEQAIFLFIDTQRTLKTKSETRPEGFTETETRLLYQLLLDDTLPGLTYREIAEKVETALGGITPLFKKLAAQGFLLKGQGAADLKNKKDLLALWVADYEKKVLPKLPIGRFRFADKERFANWKELELREGKTWWGGEPAADLHTQYLRPGLLTLYTREDRLTLIKKYRLVPDPAGNVTMLRPFWSETADTSDITVPPLLIYADLLATGDPRCTETAQLLYERSLAAQF